MKVKHMGPIRKFQPSPDIVTSHYADIMLKVD